jgi:hypothetical protein
MLNELTDIGELVVVRVPGFVPTVYRLAGQRVHHCLGMIQHSLLVLLKNRHKHHESESPRHFLAKRKEIILSSKDYGIS